jgi:hypothetical protein
MREEAQKIRILFQWIDSAKKEQRLGKREKARKGEKKKKRKKGKTKRSQKAIGTWSISRLGEKEGMKEQSWRRKREESVV